MKLDMRYLFPNPSKIVCLAYNYRDLLGDGAGPLIFLKPPSSIVWGSAPIAIPTDRPVWAEVELALVIGRMAHRVSIGEAMGHIFGYTVANDVTMENEAGRDWHLAASKGRDTFCPINPQIETAIDTSCLAMQTSISGRVTQQSNTGQRIWDDCEAVSRISHLMTLEPGDVILTGTPAGARDSVLIVGDTVITKIAGLGKLANWVVKV